MDAVTRISYYFPTHGLTTFWIVANIIVNNKSSCSSGASAILIGVFVVLSLIVFFASFTDTYVATDRKKYWVFICPMYGPLSWRLPSDEDRDRLWDTFYLRKRDYLHALLSVTTFVLICVFSNPVAMCLFPKGPPFVGSANMDDVLIRTVPIVVAVVMALIMICLGPPRQMIGFGNIPETVPPVKEVGSDNPILGEYPHHDHASRSDSGLEMAAPLPPPPPEDNYNQKAVGDTYKSPMSMPGRSPTMVNGGGTGKAAAREQSDRTSVRDSYRDNPAAGYRDNPAASYRDNPAAGYRDNPAAGYRDNPAASYRDNPAAGYRDRDNTAIHRDNPAASYRDNTSSQIASPRSATGYTDQGYPGGGGGPRNGPTPSPPRSYRASGDA